MHAHADCTIELKTIADLALTKHQSHVSQKVLHSSDSVDTQQTILMEIFMDGFAGLQKNSSFDECPLHPSCPGEGNSSTCKN